ncbi:DnaA ATPase domain-containing protein [Streptomyces sp. TRM68416]|uniref:DnaA ATPase domain-containing protein n=1 Tax=Streptomyces sp. TRM68416 TaxID=2758412 RepID=UPI00166196DF|nr:DnaA/Hda family protein [Streptomyces sp. TRM68416]MBD0838815.1 ATP-binding protein [Streptomyces sp. TRM68416]
MHSSSDDTPSARDSWLQERRDESLARFDTKIPALYQGHIAIEQAACSWAVNRTDSTSLFLTGAIGVGKTHTAWRVCRLWLEHAHDPDTPWKGSPVIATTRATSLFDGLRPDAQAEGRRLVEQCQTADLLFIDDLAAARASDWTRERLFEIFDERYINRRPVVITSDVLPGHLTDVIGPRVASRLAEMCRGNVVLIEGDDRRKGGTR